MRTLGIQLGRTFQAVYPSEQLEDYNVSFQYGGSGRNVATVVTPYSSEDGGYLAVLTPDVTASLPPGDYNYEFVAEKSDQDGNVTTSLPLAQGRARAFKFADAQNELKWVEAALRNAQAALVDLSDGAEISLTVQGGNSYGFETRSDLLIFIGNLQKTLRRLEMDAMYGPAPSFVDVGDLVYV